MSAVEVTKSLRDRSKSIDSRVQLAYDILNGKNPAIIPRKEIVILDWAFDMLAINLDAVNNAEVWKLILSLWPKTPCEGRERTFKNHKFVSIIIDALTHLPEDAKSFVEIITECCTLIMKSIQGPLFQFYSDQQASQLLLAYCSCEEAVHNEQMSSLVYNAFKLRTHIFKKVKDDQVTLDSILNEDNAERRLYYLRDFLSVPDHTVTPSKNSNKIDSIILAICDVDIQNDSDTENVNHDISAEATKSEAPSETSNKKESPKSLTQNAFSTRIVNICTKFPDVITKAIEIVYSKRPSALTTNIILTLLKIALDNEGKEVDWPAVRMCIQYNPASLLAESGFAVNKLLSKSFALPDDVLAMIINSMADMRKFSEFIQLWKPDDLTQSKTVEDAFTRSFDSLPLAQIVKSLDQMQKNNDHTHLIILRLMLQSLSYQTASTPLISSKLTEIFEDHNIPDELRAYILNIQPSIKTEKISKKDNAFIILRCVELGLVDNPESLSNSASKHFISDSDTSTPLLFRYFPTLEKYLDEHRIKKIIKKTTLGDRIKLANNHDLLECPKITSALIDVSISQEELDVLNLIPKQVYSWEQRHAAVEKFLLKDEYTFKQIGPLISRILDSQNPPSLSIFEKGLLRLARGEDAQLILEIFVGMKANYLNEILKIHDLPEWQRCCVYCALSKKSPEENQHMLDAVIGWIEKNYKFDRSDYFTVILSMLNMFPDLPRTATLVRHISLELSSKIPSGEFPEVLFHLLCVQNHDCNVVTAFYIFTEYRFDQIFIEYLRNKDTETVKYLLYKAIDENLYNVLKAVISSRLISDTPQISNAITVSILKASVDENIANDANFWEFCDVVLREQPNIMSQFALETILELVVTTSKNINADELIWEKKSIVVSRIFLFKRHSLRKRLHLAVNALTQLLFTVVSPRQALLFYRLVDNLCNPTLMKAKSIGNHNELTSQVSRERRHVGKYIGVLLQNIILTIISNTNRNNIWTQSNNHLRGACLLIIDLIYGDGLKSVSAGMDGASRAYLKSLFEYYKNNGRWSGDD